MKYLFSLLTTVIICFQAHTKVIILDQNANAPSGTYSTFIAAQGAASNGDTILVIPSSASYGNITISKQITIIGVGFNPDMEPLVRSQFIDIDTDNGLSNITLSGLVIRTFEIGRTSTSGTHQNIIIEKCQLNFITYDGVSNNHANIFIRQNVFLPTTSLFPAIDLSSSTQSNIVVSNNVFSRADIARGLINITSGGIIDHNVFLGTGSATSHAFETLSGSTVTNNIFYGRQPTARLSVSNSTFFNNLTFGTNANDLSDDNASGTGNLSFGTNVTGDANISGSDPQFVNMPTISASLTGWDYTNDANLEAGSPALGAGNDIVEADRDLGIYGGSAPFKDTGVSLPVVKSLIFPSTIKEGTNNNATIIVTGN